MVIDPLELGGATRRRRIYILMVPEDVRLKVLRSHMGFREEAQADLQDPEEA